MDRTAAGTRAHREAAAADHGDAGQIGQRRRALGLHDPQGARLQQEQPPVAVDRPLDVLRTAAVGLDAHRVARERAQVVEPDRGGLLLRVGHRLFHRAGVGVHHQTHGLARDS